MDYDQFKRKLGTRLTNLRKDAGYTHEQVAQALGKKCDAYSAHEEGRSAPSLPEIYKLRKLYGFQSIDELMDFLM